MLTRPTSMKSTHVISRNPILNANTMCLYKCTNSRATEPDQSTATFDIISSPVSQLKAADECDGVYRLPGIMDAQDRGAVEKGHSVQAGRAIQRVFRCRHERTPDHGLPGKPCQDRLAQYAQVGKP